MICEVADTHGSVADARDVGEFALSLLKLEKA
jgi:hypothetical protein